MKQIVIAGAVGRDAVLRRTQGGDPVLGFPVAVKRVGRDGGTLWFDVSLWGVRAERLEPLIRKGGKVTVCGDLDTREHAGKTYLTVRASEVTLQDSRDEDAPHRTRGDGTTTRDALRDHHHAPLDDDIPF